MARALIIGGGAIGRGFLPWSFEDLPFDIYDASEALCQSMAERGGYSSFMSVEGELLEKKFCPDYASSKFADFSLDNYDIVFIAVGPRNCANLPPALAKFGGPIFSIENDPNTVKIIKEGLGIGNVYFGVPDVIASSTASPSNLAKDPLSLHTEDGVLYLEDSASVGEDIKPHLPNVQWVTQEKLSQEWDAKLFLHNTPHCIAAYLGFMWGRNYVHEGFSNSFVTRVVEGVIEELVLALKRNTNHNHDFLESYADKELRRFSNELLFDPISRVAREPLRKLAPGGRLMGALSMCLLSGVNPVHLGAGIAAALSYHDPSDRDYKSMQYLKHLEIKDFLSYFLEIMPDSLESRFVSKTHKDALQFLKLGLS